MEQQLMNELVNFCKTVLRITHSKLDAEIEITIKAFVIECNIVGYENVILTNDYVKNALKNYICAEFDFNNKGDKYREVFEKTLTKIALTSVLNNE